MSPKVGGHTIVAMYVGSSPIALAYAGVVPAWASEGIEVPEPDLIPNANFFLSVNDAELNTLITSGYILPDGYDTATTVTIVGGEYQVSTGLWSSAPGTISPGQPVRVRRNSSASYETLVQVVLTVGGVAMPFSILTLQEDVNDPDTTPNSNSFTSVGNAEPTTLITSASITPDGYDTVSPVTITGGEYQIGAGAWTNAPGNINPGESIKVRGTSSDQFNTPIQVVLTIGGIPFNFTVTTRIADTIPNAASFTAATDVMRNTLTISDYITPTGYEAPAVVTVTAGEYPGEYQINSGAWVNTPGTISPGDQIRVRGVSAASYNTPIQVTATIGGVPMTFTVTTGAEVVAGSLSSFEAAQTSVPGSIPYSFMGTIANDIAVGYTLNIERSADGIRDGNGRFVTKYVWSNGQTTLKHFLTAQQKEDKFIPLAALTDDGYVMPANTFYEDYWWSNGAEGAQLLEGPITTITDTIAASIATWTGADGISRNSSVDTSNGDLTCTMGNSPGAPACVRANVPAAGMQGYFETTLEVATTSNGTLMLGMLEGPPKSLGPTGTFPVIGVGTLGFSFRFTVGSVNFSRNFNTAAQSGGTLTTACAANDKFGILYDLDPTGDGDGIIIKLYHCPISTGTWYLAATITLTSGLPAAGDWWAGSAGYASTTRWTTNFGKLAFSNTLIPGDTPFYA